MAEDISITADDWASSIEDSGSSADSVSFGDQDISINDGDSGSSSTSSTSSTSTNSDDSYDVPSGYVGAANAGNTDNGGSVSRDTGVQSAQLDQIEDATEGNIDKMTATLGGEGKADDALTVETDQNEVVTATPTGNGSNQPVSEGGYPWGNIPKKAILGALLVLIAVFGGGR